ncbi:MAG TPA: EamA family transporter [Chthoniobacterales bacterium]|jgi:drug/metabolite transporter (DMT)-like permease|nr:EamA family transporter [Chthoniobacterales bacterium]
MARPDKLLIISAFAALYLIWGSTYLAILFAIGTIPPLLMAGARFLVAGFIMYAIARWKGAPRESLANWRTALVIGGCLLLGGNGGVTLAEQYVSSGLASVIVATVPIYIALLAWWSGIAPKPTPIVWLGLAGGFAGVAILLAPALHFSPNDTSHPGTGMLILLCSSFIWSAGSIYSRKAKNVSPPLLLAAQQMICGGALLTVAGLVMGEHRRFDSSRISLLSIGSFAYLVVVGALVGYTAYIFLLRHCNPAKVATYAYVNPIVAVILGALFAGETLGPRAVVAAGLIIGSVALVITVQQAKAKLVPPEVACLETANET